MPLIVRALATLFIALSLSAQDIQTNTGIIIQGTTVEHWGEAQHVDAEGELDDIAISGNFTLFERTADYPWEIVNYLSFIGADGSWSDSVTYSGYYDTCYNSTVVARSNDVDDRRDDSGTGCTFPPPIEPPVRHGYDLCPLLVDLEGNGFRTSGIEDPVMFFDTDFDGLREPSTWTAPATDDAFLWMDIDGSGAPDPGELFGSGMSLPNGVRARNGFEALGVYDRPEFGGTGDGVIDRNDAVWDRLRLWVDTDHDARRDPHEISTPGSHQIIAFGLTARREHRYDEAFNVLMLPGSYMKQVFARREAPSVRQRALSDIAFNRP